MLHLHAGPPLENEGGPRARVRVPRDGGLRACVVSGWSRPRFCLRRRKENNLDDKVLNERWMRWYTCGLCEQRYHGVVWCALGWACWKTYLGRPETDWNRRLAMQQLGNGLCVAGHYEDALSVKEAELAMLRRLGADEEAYSSRRQSCELAYEAWTGERPQT